MFPEIPPEIILNICSHLDSADKLQLKTTCHKLNDLITPAILYENFNLLHLSRWKNPESLVQKLISDKFDGSFVRVLSFDIDDLPKQLIPQLSNIFPNVTRFITSDCIDTIYSRKHQPTRYNNNNNNIQPLIKWRTTIEKIFSRVDWMGLTDDLMFSTYPRLTVLDLDGPPNILKRCVGKNPYSFLRNAPLLSVLTLRKVNIDLEVLEAMHEGFPRLKSLRFINVKMERKKGIVLPHPIAPAGSLLYFALFKSNGFHNNGDTLDYMLKKYTNLKQLVYCIEDRADYSKMTSEDISMYFDTKTEPENNLSTKQTLDLSRRALEYSFFLKLPRSLKGLALDVNNIENCIAALAEAEIKITGLDLLNCRKDDSIFEKKKPGDSTDEKIWKDPKMLNNFRKLTSLKTLKVAFDSSVQTFTSDFISCSVTRLDMGLYGGSFCIDWALSMFPALEELYINHENPENRHLLEREIMGRKVDDHSGNKKELRPAKEYPKLRVLRIRKRPLHPNLFYFIRTALPNLDELDLEIDLGRELSRKITHTFNLSNLLLKKCSISFNSHDTSLNVYCIITIQNVSRYFEVDFAEKVLLPVNRRYKHIENRIWVEIILEDHINHLTIFGFTVVKIGDKIVIEL